MSSPLLSEPPSDNTSRATNLRRARPTQRAARSEAIGHFRYHDKGGASSFSGAGDQGFCFGLADSPSGSVADQTCVGDEGAAVNVRPIACWPRSVADGLDVVAIQIEYVSAAVVR
jgi:hypothetical protein